MKSNWCIIAVASFLSATNVNGDFLDNRVRGGSLRLTDKSAGKDYHVHSASADSVKVQEKAEIDHSERFRSKVQDTSPAGQQQVSRFQDSTPREHVGYRLLKELHPPGFECGEEETLQCTCKRDNSLFNNGHGNGEKVPTSSPSKGITSSPTNVCNGECYKYDSVTRALTIDTSSNDVCEASTFCVETVVSPTQSPTRAPSSSPSLLPSSEPSSFPSSNPSLIPSTLPSSRPSSSPSSNPSSIPSPSPSKVPTGFPTTESLVGCGRQDIVFLMDSSGSVGQVGWDSTLSNVVEFVRNFDPESDDVRYGLVQFSSSGSVFKKWYFNDNQDLEVIEDLIMDFPWLEGQTATRSALEDAMDIVQWTGPDFVTDDDISIEAEKNYYIENVQTTFILITDGNPYPYAEQNPCRCQAQCCLNSLSCCDYAERAALEVREDLSEWGIKVILVGVGDEWNPSILSCLVEDDDAQILFIENFDELFIPGLPGDLVYQTFQKMCNEGLNSKSNSSCR